MSSKQLTILLRIGVFCTFFGHGAVAFTYNPKWIGYLNTVGFSDDLAYNLLPVIGVLDIFVALVILIKPNKYVILWAVFWAFSAALIRPISGESIFAFIERGANWMLPLVLYVYTQRFSKQSYSLN